MLIAMSFFGAGPVSLSVVPYHDAKSQTAPPRGREQCNMLPSFVSVRQGAFKWSMALALRVSGMALLKNGSVITNCVIKKLTLNLNEQECCWEISSSPSVLSYQTIMENGALLFFGLPIPGPRARFLLRNRINRLEGRIVPVSCSLCHQGLQLPPSRSQS